MSNQQIAPSRLLADIIHNTKYARYLPEQQRRELFHETVERNEQMHIKKFPFFKQEINEAYKLVYEKKILPSMRALEDSTPIITKQGWKTAGEIKKGDTLYASNGTETTVLKTIKFKEKDLYEIIFSDNSIIQACGEHLWIISTQDDRKNKKTRVVDTFFIQKHLKQGNKSNIFIKNPEPIYREEKNLELDPYILGHWLGDGYSSGHQISLSTEDSDFICTQYEQQGFKTKQSSSSNILTYTVQGLAKYLKKLNLLNNKHIPQDFIHSSISQRISLLQGLMDSDGYITTSGRCFFYNTNNEIITGVEELLSSIGIKYIKTCHEKNKKHHKKLYVLSFFTNLPVARLPRKSSNIGNTNSKRTSFRSVKSITYIGKGNATCFHVDSEDHSFLASKQMIVTHNSLQFGGVAVEKNNTRIFNCSACHIDSPEVFQEIMFLLLSGCGVGYSVQKHHIDKLPSIKKPEGSKFFEIDDSIEGWSYSIGTLVDAFFYGKPLPLFIYDKIRKAGSPLITSGGVAPGPEPLKEAHQHILRCLMKKKIGEKLLPIEAHDILCFMAMAVLSGGIRRSSYIALFNKDDLQMMQCKGVDWWKENPQRALANNSPVILRNELTPELFNQLWTQLEKSGSGEPNIFQTNSLEEITNPCFGPKERLLTPGGYETFENLATKCDIKIINADGQIVPSKVWCSGRKKTIQIKNTNGDVFTCTPDHRWKTTTGNIVEAQNLKGHRLMPYLRNNKNEDILSFFDTLYVKLGFIQGDGILSRLKSKDHLGLEINISKKDNEILNLFNFERKNPDQYKFYTTEFKEKLLELGFSSSCLPERTMPTSFDKWNLIQKLSFLRGLFSANGCVIKGHRIALKTTCADFAIELKKILDDMNMTCYITTNKSTEVEFNNGTYICCESYDVNISQFHGIITFHNTIGFVHEYKKRSLAELVLQKSPQIISIKPGDEIEVYDFTEPTTNWGVVQSGYNNDKSNWFIAHNCGEIALKNNGLCNLVEINAATIKDQIDLENRAKMASRIATLQASYTNFHLLRKEWQRNAEEESLIGVGMTGIAAGKVMNLNLQKAAHIVVLENEKTANKIGIKKAKRTTTVKPAGTTSLELGNGVPISSGVHSYHAEYYLRRIIINHTEPIYEYLKRTHPLLIEPSAYRPDRESVLTIPLKAPKGAITRWEGPIALLERIKYLHQNWIIPGHIEGQNTNNVSCTISVKEEEWDIVKEWWWKNKEHFVSITLLPYDGGNYQQLPFEECSCEQYEEMVKTLTDIDLTKIKEIKDMTSRQQEAACSGGYCERI